MTEKYKIKDEIEHVLDRPSTYTGSTIDQYVPGHIYMPSKNNLKYYEEILYNPALHKIVDEVFSNSIDEYRRSFKKESLFNIDKISVDINENGMVTIEDNGGIPVRKHKELDVYIPEMIFSMLRTSSNYDDSEDRDWIGVNGIGAKLSNIFSKSFQVVTCDGKNKFDGTWTNNMRDFKLNSITPCKEHYTRIKFEIELSRFERDKLDLNTIRLFQKRCIDSAAANPGLMVNFTSDIAEGKLNTSWKFDSFKQYVELYLNQEELTNGDIVHWNNGRDQVIFVMGSSLPDVAFINGALCSKGTHIAKLRKQLTDVMFEKCKSEEMELITLKDINTRFTVFALTSIYNPVYADQRKETLDSKIEQSKLKFDPKIIQDILNSNLFNYLKDYYDVKYAEHKKKETRRLNAAIKSTKIKKLIKPGVNDAKLNELFLFEGTSASSGFRKHRLLYQAAYLLKGKILNTFGMGKSRIVENQELREILAILNLKFDDPIHNIKNMPYNKIIICSDMDEDGNHIAGLILTFLSLNFPELFKHNKVFRALSPIIKATKGKDVKYFYSLQDFKKIENSLKGYDYKYTKGLGGLSDIDYRELLQNQKLVSFRIENKDDIEAVKIWFDKSTKERKELLTHKMED